MTGIELITAERYDQVANHGFDSDHDANHDIGVLKKAALIALGEPYTNAVMDCDWNDFEEHIKKQSEVKRLTVAGALIAAEIDRIQDEQL